MSLGVAARSLLVPQLDWALAYQALDNILGNSFTQLPLGDPKFGLHTSTTMVGRRKHADGLAPTWTFPVAPSGFTKPFDPESESCYKGIIPFYDFQGVDNERATTPDDPFWTPALTPFSYACWVNLPVNLTTATLLHARSDQTVGAVKTEVEVYINTDETFHVALYANSDLEREKNRSYSSPLALGAWHHLVAVYDGGVGASSIKLYLNAAQVDNSDESSVGDFTGGVSNTTELTRLGHVISASATVTGKAKYLLAGGPCGPIYGREALTPAQIENTYRLQMALLGV